VVLRKGTAIIIIFNNLTIETGIKDKKRFYKEKSAVKKKKVNGEKKPN